MIQNTRPNQPFTGQRRRTKKWRFWSGHDNLLTSISLSFSGEISDVHFIQDYTRISRIRWLYVFIIQEEWTTLPSRKIKVLITDARREKPLVSSTKNYFEWAQCHYFCYCYALFNDCTILWCLIAQLDSIENKINVFCLITHIVFLSPIKMFALFWELIWVFHLNIGILYFYLYLFEFHIENSSKKIAHGSSKPLPKNVAAYCHVTTGLTWQRSLFSQLSNCFWEFIKAMISLQMTIIPNIFFKPLN